MPSSTEDVSGGAVITTVERIGPDEVVVSLTGDFDVLWLSPKAAIQLSWTLFWHAVKAWVS